MCRFLVAFVCACVLTLPAVAQDLLTPSQFRDAAITMMRRIDPQAEISVRDERGLDVRRPHQTDLPEYFVNLDQAYAEYRANPGAQQQILERWVRFATTVPENNRAADRVVGIIRPRVVIDQFAADAAGLRSASDPELESPIWRPFAGDLVEVMAFDGAETVQYAMPSSLAEIGLTPEQAWGLTSANIPNRIGTLEGGGVGGADRLIFITGGNGLAPSSLLNGGVCSNGAEHFAFLVVDRNGYVSGDRRDPVALRQFREMLQYLRGAGGAFSLTPLGCLDGRVVQIDLTD